MILDLKFVLPPSSRQLSLWIFPEGTRSNLPVPDMLPFKKGAFHLAVQSQIPIVPVVVENYHRLFDGKTRFEGGTIRIKVLPPVSTEGLGKDDVSALSDRVRAQMLETLKEFDRQREDFDVSTVSSASTSTPPNVALAETGMGGVAGWVGKIIGTGKGRDFNAKARRDAERLRARGTSGEKPEDYHLVSEKDRVRAEGAGAAASSSSSGVAAAAATSTTQRKTTSSNASTRSSNNSNGAGEGEDTDGSTILVERPQ